MSLLDKLVFGSALALSFFMSVYVSAVYMLPRRVYTIELNGDGVQDVIVTNRLGCTIFLGQEDGTFREKKKDDVINQKKLELLLETMKIDAGKTDGVRYTAPIKKKGD